VLTRGDCLQNRRIYLPKSLGYLPEERTADLNQRPQRPSDPRPTAQASEEESEENEEDTFIIHSTKYSTHFRIFLGC
jgi:hypothetical protein